jgi:hypothetical protein
VIRDQREDVFARLTAGGATELAARADRPDFVTHETAPDRWPPAPGHHHDVVSPCSNPSVSPVESKRSHEREAGVPGRARETLAMDELRS